MGYTFLELQDRISDEINDGSNVSVSLTMVKQAIVSAIEHYERQQMWFNERINLNLVCTSGSPVIVPPADILMIRKLQYDQSSTQRLALDQIDYQDWADMSYTASTTGQPTSFAYYNDQILLYPTPNAAYSMVLSYIARLPKLIANTDRNGWTDTCEALIRNRAKWDIFDNLLYMPDHAKRAKQHEFDALSMIEMERAQRGTTGRTKAYYL